MMRARRFLRSAFSSRATRRTIFRDVIVALDNIGSLGTNGVQGINIDTRFIDGLDVLDNICRDNRGIRITNCRSKTLVRGNRVTAATRQARCRSKRR